MAKLVNGLSAKHIEFIKKQKMFFVATAPLGQNTFINLSPKGLEHTQVINSQEIAYMDFTGSGNETSAHLLENGRITLMFCSFDKVPNILRIYGSGKVILPNDKDWDTYASLFHITVACRQIITIAIKAVQTSCGYGVPMYTYIGDRDTMYEWGNKKGKTGINQYQKDNNLYSLDGLPTHLQMNENKM